jgi:hypothetical protein
MAYDRNKFPGFQRLAGAHDVLDQRAAPRAVQHFSQRGFQPCAFARGQNHDCDVGVCHADIVSGSRQFYNPARRKAMRKEHFIQQALEVPVARPPLAVHPM